MDAPQTAVESCALLKHARGCKLTLLVALQNVLLTACLLAALFVYWAGKDQDPVHHEIQQLSEDVSIVFFPINDITENTTLKFKHILHQHRMNLSGNSRISTECSGPYILYMSVCYMNISKSLGSGSLQLQVAGGTDPLCKLELHTHHQSDVCRGLQTNIYLRKKEKAELHFYSDNLTLKNVTVGFNYLLKSRCED